MTKWLAGSVVLLLVTDAYARHISVTHPLPDFYLEKHTTVYTEFMDCSAAYTYLLAENVTVSVFVTEENCAAALYDVFDRTPPENHGGMFYYNFPITTRELGTCINLQLKSIGVESASETFSWIFECTAEEKRNDFFDPMSWDWFIWAISGIILFFAFLVIVVNTYVDYRTRRRLVTIIKSPSEERKLHDSPTFREHERLSRRRMAPLVKGSEAELGAAGAAAAQVRPAAAPASQPNAGASSGNQPPAPQPDAPPESAQPTAATASNAPAPGTKPSSEKQEKGVAPSGTESQSKKPTPSSDEKKTTPDVPPAAAKKASDKKASPSETSSSATTTTGATSSTAGAVSGAGSTPSGSGGSTPASSGGSTPASSGGSTPASSGSSTPASGSSGSTPGSSGASSSAPSSDQKGGK